MINLYVDKRAIGSNSKFIYSVDLTFDKEIYNLNITDEDRRCMQIIDKADYVGNGYIETPFGKTEIQNLSTGCKTIILINHSDELGNAVVNIGECGKNVLELIFSKNSLNLYLDYCIIPNKYNPEQMINVISYNVSKKMISRKEMNLRDVFNKVWRRR